MTNLPIHTIVAHYSATYPDQDINAADIDRMHRQRGFAGIGYHYFIKRDGTVETGRAEHAQGAHVLGHNKNTLGICWAGGLERVSGPNKGVDNRTPDQTASLISLIRDLLKRHPGAKVTGHRDMPGASTQCPGFDVAAWWKSVNEMPFHGPSLLVPGEYQIQMGCVGVFDTNGRLVVR